MKSNSSKLLKVCIISAALLLIGRAGAAQQTSDHNSYVLKPAPDVWFNSVDGIRVGLRLRGGQEEQLKDGPHRLDAGFWLSTFFPTYPFSYYVSFTEPIPAISSYNSEGNIRLRSSIRTGYSKQEISFNKRWQPGFNEKNYRELSLNFRTEHRFDDEYALYPGIWQNDRLYIAGLNFRLNNNNPLGRYRLKSSTSINFAGSFDSFINERLSLQQNIPLGNLFDLRARLFAGLSSNNTAPEYQFTHSFQPYVLWDRLGTTRAKGTIPTAWVRRGIVQIAGGANLRGYTNTDIEQLNAGQTPLFNSLGAVNVDLQYANPINKTLESIPFAGLLNFRSYLFFDSGTSLGIAQQEESRVLSDAGPGFSLSINIPDYLGKSRGFEIRYEIPLWLSDPYLNDAHFQFRSLLGIGAVISL